MHGAWAFCREKVFSDLAGKLVLEARASDDARFLNASEEDILELEPMLSDILGEMSIFNEDGSLLLNHPLTSK